MMLRPIQEEYLFSQQHPEVQQPEPVRESTTSQDCLYMLITAES